MRSRLAAVLVVFLVHVPAHAQGPATLPVRTDLRPEWLEVAFSLPTAGHLLVLDVTNFSGVQVLTPDSASVALPAGSHSVRLERTRSGPMYQAALPRPNYPPCYETKPGETVLVWTGNCGLEGRVIATDPPRSGLTLAGQPRQVLLLIFQNPMTAAEVNRLLDAAQRGAARASWRQRLLEESGKIPGILSLAQVEVPGH